MAERNDDEACHVMSERLSRMFPRVARGLWRRQSETRPETSTQLGPRHVAALQQLLAGPRTVGDLAGSLELSLPTASGLVADLDRADFVERRTDPADRRRTLVEITPARRGAVDRWLEGAVAPLARVLDRLTADERTAFLKAMEMFESEFTGADGMPIDPPSAAAGCPAAD